MKITVKTRKFGSSETPETPWIEAVWMKVKDGWSVIFAGTEIVRPQERSEYRTLRKVVYRNWHRWKFRRKLLNLALRKRKLGIYADFWWAKFWRRGGALRNLATELRDEPDLPSYVMSNRERADQILTALNQAEGYYLKFQELFNDVDPMLGYGVDVIDFIKVYKKRFKKEPEHIRYVPPRYIAYFSDPVF